MTITLNELQQDINDVVEIHESVLESTEGSGKRQVPEGTAIAVVTGYIELGRQANKKGTIKNVASLEVELFDIEGEDGEPKYTRTIKVKDEAGKESDKTIGSRCSHRLGNISRNELSHFRKNFDVLFKACQLEGVKSPIRLLGHKFLVDVLHNKSDDGKNYLR